MTRILSRFGAVAAALAAALAKFGASNVVTPSSGYPVPQIKKAKKAKYGQIRRYHTKKQKTPRQTVRRK
jgi:hypothetical protein